MSIDNPPIRFFAISYGRYDDYQEYFILATSPNDALKRFLRSHSVYFGSAGTVYEADLDANGMLIKTIELYGVELPGEKGYLWDSEAARGVRKKNDKMCRLCGIGDKPEIIINDKGKCQTCAALRQIEK